jgi:hypothetical protein
MLIRRMALGSAFAVLAIAGGVSASSAETISGTFDVSVYQGPGHGNINNANNQAQQGNPLINAANLLGTGTYTGALDLDLGSNGTNTIGAFFSSNGSSLVGCSASCLNAVVSTANFGTTSVFVITGNTNGLTLNGSIEHDDGVSLYDGVNFSHLVAGAPSPTVETDLAFTGLTGAFELVYVEANGLPAVLDMEVTATPLPAALPLFASGLGALGLLGWRRKRTPRSLAA